LYAVVKRFLVPTNRHNSFHKDPNRTSLSCVSIKGKPKRQQIWRHVSAARSLDDEALDDNGEAAIIFDVLSTHVKIKSLPDLDNGTGPIRSMAQLENGSTGTAE
jgi:hypothetical protein